MLTHRFSHWTVIVVVVLTLASSTPAVAAGAHPLRAGSGGTSADSEVIVAPSGERWIWPTTGFRLTRPYIAPAHRYGPGHRGIDLALFGTESLRAPASGVVAFVGTVVDRDVLTIDHGGGLLSTLEPIVSHLSVGQRVRAGEVVAEIGRGGHSPEGTVHFGVRLDGEYINPLLLLGGVPRAILLPCC